MSVCLYVCRSVGLQNEILDEVSRRFLLFKAPARIFLGLSCLYACLLVCPQNKLLETWMLFKLRLGASLGYPVGLLVCLQHEILDEVSRRFSFFKLRLGSSGGYPVCLFGFLQLKLLETSMLCFLQHVRM